MPLSLLRWVSSSPSHCNCSTLSSHLTIDKKVEGNPPRLCAAPQPADLIFLSSLIPPFMSFHSKQEWFGCQRALLGGGRTGFKSSQAWDGSTLQGRAITPGRRAKPDHAPLHEGHLAGSPGTRSWSWPKSFVSLCWLVWMVTLQGKASQVPHVVYWKGIWGMPVAQAALPQQKSPSRELGMWHSDTETCLLSRLLNIFSSKACLLWRPLHQDCLTQLETLQVNKVLKY